MASLGSNRRWSMSGTSRQKSTAFSRRTRRVEHRPPSSIVTAPLPEVAFPLQRKFPPTVSELCRQIQTIECGLAEGIFKVLKVS
jgi:hypothetical protein